VPPFALFQLAKVSSWGMQYANALNSEKQKQNPVPNGRDDMQSRKQKRKQMTLKLGVHKQRSEAFEIFHLFYNARSKSKRQNLRTKTRYRIARDANKWSRIAAYPTTKSPSSLKFRCVAWQCSIAGTENSNAWFAALQPRMEWNRAMCLAHVHHISIEIVVSFSRVGVEDIITRSEVALVDSSAGAPP
jgi:hypothetical protein